MADQGNYIAIDDELQLEDEFYRESVVEIRVDEEEGAEEESSSSQEVFAMCEDCANQWDDEIAAEGTEKDLFCPLCGSNRIFAS